jgi:DNA-binding GntR family transcriptional regulator
VRLGQPRQPADRTRGHLTEPKERGAARCQLATKHQTIVYDPRRVGIIYDLQVGPTAPATKQELVHRALRERILAGVYGPGDRVVIDAIAAEFKVSALPVREAIRRLEAEGLVIFRPNAGAQVSPADPGQFHEEMTTLAVLEGYATALAAPLMDERHLGRLAEITDAMEEASSPMDSGGFGRLNWEFHGLLVEPCPNVTLLTMVRDIGRRLESVRQTVFVHIPYRGAESVAEHRVLVGQIASGAPARAIERTAREHKLRTLETFRAQRGATHITRETQ